MLNLYQDYIKHIDIYDSDLKKIKEFRLKYYKLKEKDQLIKNKFDRLNNLNIKSNVFIEKGVIYIKNDKNIQKKYLENINEFICELKPWKKGPYNIFGNFIDSEWRSDIKWQRIQSQIPKNIEDKVIADIGCHNGYFIWRLLDLNPKWVIGFEPCFRYRLMNALLQKFVFAKNFTIEPFYVKDMFIYKNVFDIILFLGVLYHLKNPIESLEILHGSLKKNAKLILESQAVESKESIALIPKSRYAGAKGMWFIPSKDCLFNWLKRVGFRKIDCFYSAKLTSNEQRYTKFDNIKSLDDFIDQKNAKTIEGYDLPIRLYFIAYK